VTWAVMAGINHNVGHCHADGTSPTHVHQVPATRNFTSERCHLAVTIRKSRP